MTNAMHPLPKRENDVTNAMHPLPKRENDVTNANPQMLTWDDEAVSRFKKIVNAVHGPEVPFTMVAMERDAGSKQVKTAKADFGTGAEHLQRMKRHRQKMHEQHEQVELYMLLGLTHDENYTAQNFTGSWVVAADFDKGYPDLCRPGQPLAPTIVIETSLARFHAVWVLRKLIATDDMSRLAKAIADRLGGDMSFARINQMVRVPGYANMKYGTPVIMRDDLSSGQDYDYDWLWKAIDADLYEAGVKALSPKLNHLTNNE